VRKERTLLKVYIADDSSVVRQRLVELVSTLGEVCLVGQAGDAMEAINDIQSTKPDVAILDIQMPGSNGFYVLEQIKISQPELRVIMLTAFPYPQYRQKCLNAGADYFFDKSCEFDQVTNVLIQLIYGKTPRPCNS
jgi:DNA-binding NarL/FixJ family response regulator